MGWMRPGLVATSQGKPPELHPEPIVLHDTCGSGSRTGGTNAEIHLHKSKTLLYEFYGSAACVTHRLLPGKSQLRGFAGTEPFLDEQPGFNGHGARKDVAATALPLQQILGILRGKPDCFCCDDQEMQPVHLSRKNGHT